MATMLSPEVILVEMIRFQLPISEASNTQAFRTGVDRRDSESCVVCGYTVPFTVDHCHIVPKVETAVWAMLKDQGWIPKAAKGAEHECRNGVIMCKNHHNSFDNFQYFVRFVPEVGRLRHTLTPLRADSASCSARNTSFATS